MPTEDDETQKDSKIIDELYEKMKTTKEYKMLLSSLKPLVVGIKTSYAQQMLKPCAKEISERSERMRKRALLLRRELKLETTNEFNTFLKALCYLGLFEASVTHLMDTVLMIFVANHHDFYVYNNREYAKKFDHLDNASLGEKFSFFNFHGLDIFSINLNKSLRNKIAHMDFDVLPDGKIKAEKQEYDLEFEIFSLAGFVLLITHALETLDIPEVLRKL